MVLTKFKLQVQIETKKKGQKQLVKSDEPTAVLNGVSPKNTYKQLTTAPNSNIMWKIEMIWQRLWWPSPQSKVPTIILKILSYPQKISSPLDQKYQQSYSKSLPSPVFIKNT